MLITDWLIENLTSRVIFCNCFINIGGESYSADIGWPYDMRHIRVEYKDNNKTTHVLKIYLGNLSLYGSCMFYFDHSSPGGKDGFLVIPNIKPEEDEEE